MTICGGQRDAPRDTIPKTNFRRDAGPSTALAGYPASRIDRKPLYATFRLTKGDVERSAWIGAASSYGFEEVQDISNGSLLKCSSRNVYTIPPSPEIVTRPVFCLDRKMTRVRPTPCDQD